jgi:hypothetical protein
MGTLPHPMRFALPCAIALLFAPHAFAQKIAILTFDGPGANAVRNQVVAELCDRAECVTQTKVTTKGKVDWKKVKKEKVKYVVDAKVVTRGKKKTIELMVFAKAGAGKKKVWNLDDGELNDRNLKAAGDVLGSMMGLPAKEAPEEKKPPAEEKPAPEEKKPPAEEKPAPEEKKPPADEKKVTAPPPPPKEEEEPKEEEAPVEPKVRARRPVVAIEVGLDLSSKSFSYSQVVTPNLRSYRAPFIVGPDLKAELYPLALVMQDGVLAGLGAEVGYFLAVGLKSRRNGTDVSYATSISRLDVAVKFQIRPSSKSEAHVAPFIGFRSHSFSVAPGSDMSVLDGLPAISYSALKFGIAGELPFGDTGLLVFGRFAVLPVLSASEIIGTKYFPNGSALGIDGGLGLGFKLPFLTMLQLRLAFDFARYGLTFRSAATDMYVAEGAVDQYLGGSFAVRFTY